VHLKEAIDELMRNATLYSLPAQFVTVEARAEGRSVQVSVADAASG